MLHNTSIVAQEEICSDTIIPFLVKEVFTRLFSSCLLLWGFDTADKQAYFSDIQAEFKKGLEKEFGRLVNTTILNALVKKTFNFAINFSNEELKEIVSAYLQNAKEDGCFIPAIMCLKNIAFDAGRLLRERPRSRQNSERNWNEILERDHHSLEARHLAATQLRHTLMVVGLIMAFFLIISSYFSDEEEKIVNPRNAVGVLAGMIILYLKPPAAPPFLPLLDKALEDLKSNLLAELTNELRKVERQHASQTRFKKPERSYVQDFSYEPVHDKATSSTRPYKNTQSHSNDAVSTRTKNKKTKENSDGKLSTSTDLVKTNLQKASFAVPNYELIKVRDDLYLEWDKANVESLIPREKPELVTKFYNAAKGPLLFWNSHRKAGIKTPKKDEHQEIYRIKILGSADRLFLEAGTQNEQVTLKIIGYNRHK